MTDGNGQRHRFGAIVFGLVVAAAVLAVFPATAPFGMTLCLLLVIPAIVAVWRTRRAPVGTRRRSVAALVVAPVFLLVGAGVMPHPPVTAAAVVEAAAPAATSTATPTSAPMIPVTVDPITAAPVPSQVAVPVVAQAAAPAPAVSPVVAPRVAPQALVARPAAPKSTTPKPVAAKPAAPKPVAAKPVTGSSCGANSYVNSSGNCVPRPVAAATAPVGATAQCKDGAYSFSQHHSGTCSGHGGVARWL